MFEKSYSGNIESAVMGPTSVVPTRENLHSVPGTPSKNVVY